MFKELKAIIFEELKESIKEIGIMPKSRNLPMTTREPISDAKAREFLLPSSSWGSHRYWCSSYKEEPWALGYIAYIGYYRAKISKHGSLWVWLVTFWWRVRCWVLIGSQVVGWGQGISKGSFPGTLQNGVALILQSKDGLACLVKQWLKTESIQRETNEVQ